MAENSRTIYEPDTLTIETLKRFEFSASRQLIPGRWQGNNFSGWLGVSGEVQPDTGMFINIADLKATLNNVLDDFDHRNLSAQLDPIAPTTPNVAQAIFDAAWQKLPADVRATSLELIEEEEEAVVITASQQHRVARGGFSAAHRTHAPQLSARENALRYGKCNNPAGHGHNYRVEVYLPSDQVLDPRVWDEFDHVNLSEDVPELRRRNVVTETLAELIARRAPQADRVRVWETPDFFAEYRPDDERYRLGRRYRFHAAHRLHSPALSDEENHTLYGKCNRREPHGHTYQVQVTLRSELDPRTETAFDLGCLDEHAHEILRDLDYIYLDQEIEFFTQRASTGENIAAYLWQRFVQRLPRELEMMQVWETPNNQFKVTAN
jgi:6-pyruvoyltetrahydropterin/6-carboxytetrahydropterin synthase